jgi:hypothetical protein
MCEHKNVSFEGVFSMIGSYVCQDCRLKIEPFVFHALEKSWHVLFHPERKDDLQKAINLLNPENFLKLWNKITA